MKRILQIIVATIVGMSLTMGVVSAATPECSIVNGNGTDSTNVCRFDNDVDINFTCRNGVVLNVDNDQDADSGDAEANDNTTVGNVGSGDASNNAEIMAELNASCAKAQAVATTPPTPPAGGQGGGTVSGTSTTKVAGVAALPATGSETVLAPIAIGATILGTIAIAAQIAVGLYRRITLK